jgi:hypothetical protein
MLALETCMLAQHRDYAHNLCRKLPWAGSPGRSWCNRLVTTVSSHRPPRSLSGNNCLDWNQRIRDSLLVRNQFHIRLLHGESDGAFGVGTA